jgi:hypothetical protein
MCIFMETARIRARPQRCETPRGTVSQLQITADLQGAPEDLRGLLEGLAAEGITASLPTAGPHDPLPEPLAVHTSLSTAIIEERDG